MAASWADCARRRDRDAHEDVQADAHDDDGDVDEDAHVDVRVDAGDAHVDAPVQLPLLLLPAVAAVAAADIAGKLRCVSIGS